MAKGVRRWCGSPVQYAGMVGLKLNLRSRASTYVFSFKGGFAAVTSTAVDNEMSDLNNIVATATKRMNVVGKATKAKEKNFYLMDLLYMYARLWYIGLIAEK